MPKCQLRLSCTHMANRPRSLLDWICVLPLIFTFCVLSKYLDHKYCLINRGLMKIKTPNIWSHQSVTNIDFSSPRIRYYKNVQAYVWTILLYHIWFKYRCIAHTGLSAQESICESKQIIEECFSKTSPKAVSFLNNLFSYFWERSIGRKVNGERPFVCLTTKILAQPFFTTLSWLIFHKTWQDVSTMYLHGLSENVLPLIQHASCTI